MRLNHLDLHVPDVAVARDFFVDHFGLTVLETRGRDGLAILTDGSGLELVLSRPVERLGGMDQVALGACTYHVGFLLPERAMVDALHARLRNAGWDTGEEPRNMRGAWLFYVTGPGHILIEVAHRAAPG